MKDILTRIIELEELIKIEPLIVEAETESGELIEVDVRELKSHPYWHYSRIVKGANDLEGLDIILNLIKEEAEREVNGVCD